MRALAFLLGLFCALPAWALDREKLWVRTIADCAAQTGGTCGTENGSSFENAYRGLADIAFSASDGTANTMDPGDWLVFCVAEGSYFGNADRKNATSMYTPNGTVSSGDATTPTKLDPNCSEQSGYSARAWLNGENIVTRGIDSSTGAHLYWDVGPFKITNVTSTGIYAQGASTDASYWDVHGPEVTDITGTTGRGIRLQGVGNTLRDAYIARTGDDNLYYEGCDFTAIDNVMSDPSLGGAQGDNIQGNASSCRFKILRNYLDHTKVDSKQNIFIDTTTSTDLSGTIADNTVLGPGKAATLHSGILVQNGGGGKVKIRGNFVADTQFGILCGANVACDLEGNAVARTGSHAVRCGTNSTDCRFDHNSVSDSPVCLSSEAATGTVSYTNNAAANCTTVAIRKAVANTETYNRFLNATAEVTNNTTPTTSDATDAALTDFGWAGGTAPTTAGGFCLEDDDAPLFGIGTYIGAYIKGTFGESLSKPPAIGARELCRKRQPAATRPMTSAFRPWLN